MRRSHRSMRSAARRPATWSQAPGPQTDSCSPPPQPWPRDRHPAAPGRANRQHTDRGHRWRRKRQRSPTTPSLCPEGIRASPFLGRGTGRRRRRAPWRRSSRARPRSLPPRHNGRAGAASGREPRWAKPPWNRSPYRGAAWAVMLSSLDPPWWQTVPAASVR